MRRVLSLEFRVYLFGEWISRFIRTRARKNFIMGSRLRINNAGRVEISSAGASSQLAAFAVFFNDNHSWNYTARVRNGQNTETCAAIVAASMAFKFALKRRLKNICLSTNSKFVFDCLMFWLNELRDNGWRTQEGLKPLHCDKLRFLFYIRRRFYAAYGQVTYKFSSADTGGAYDLAEKEAFKIPDRDDLLSLLRKSRDGRVKIQTDGACPSNGKSDAQAGIGVWFSNDHPWNVSEHVRGRSTNVCASIEAVTRALEIAIQQDLKLIRILNDTTFVCDSLNKFIKIWKANGWLKRDGKPPKNLIELQKLVAMDQRFRSNGGSVEYVHVKANEGQPQLEARRLAREGSRKTNFTPL